MIDHDVSVLVDEQKGGNFQKNQSVKLIRHDTCNPISFLKGHVNVCVCHHHLHRIKWKMVGLARTSERTVATMIGCLNSSTTFQTFRPDVFCVYLREKAPLNLPLFPLILHRAPSLIVRKGKFLILTRACRLQPLNSICDVLERFTASSKILFENGFFSSSCVDIHRERFFCFSHSPSCCYLFPCHREENEDYGQSIHTRKRCQAPTQFYSNLFSTQKISTWTQWSRCKMKIKISTVEVRLFDTEKLMCI